MTNIRKTSLHKAWQRWSCSLIQMWWPKLSTWHKWSAEIVKFREGKHNEWTANLHCQFGMHWVCAKHRIESLHWAVATHTLPTHGPALEVDQACVKVSCISLSIQMTLWPHVLIPELMALLDVDACTGRNVPVMSLFTGQNLVGKWQRRLKGKTGKKIEQEARCK